MTNIATRYSKAQFMEAYHLRRNPVVDAICMSGECLCGAFASPGEIAEIEVAFPKAAQLIHELEAEAAAVGVHAKWGTRPPGARRTPSKSGRMCHSCAVRKDRP